MTSLSRVQAKRSTLSCNQRLRYLMFTDNERFCVHTAMYKCLHYTGPHLHTLLTSFVRWQMSRLVSDSVPCSSSSSLIVSRTRLLTVGDRAFPVAAARVWNSLPDLVTSAPSVAVFRSRLKTHLFNISYPCDCTVPAQ